MEFKDISKEIAVIARGYQYHRPPEAMVKIQDFIAQMYQWLLEALKALRLKFPGMADNRLQGDIIQILLYLAGIVAVTAILYVLWHKLLQLKDVRKAREKSGAIKIEVPLSSLALKEQANRLAQDDKFKEACRALYLCFLQLIHEKNIVVFAPAKTNYEYQLILSRYPVIQKSFCQLSSYVELVWFGNKIASSSDYQQCLRILAVLEQQVDKL